MTIIPKKFLVTEFSRNKYKSNRIALNTLKIIKNRKFKIKPISFFLVEVVERLSFKFAKVDEPMSIRAIKK
jgi:hypothetical protein